MGPLCPAVLPVAQLYIPHLDLGRYNQVILPRVKLYGPIMVLDLLDQDTSPMQQSIRVLLHQEPLMRFIFVQVAFSLGLLLLVHLTGRCLRRGRYHQAKLLLGALILAPLLLVLLVLFMSPPVD